MGHTQCGAIRATLQALEAAGAAESKNQQSIVDRIKPHISDFARPGSDGDFEARYAAAVKANVLASARELRRSSPILEDLVERGHIAIVGAVYDLATGVVTFLE